MRTAFTIGVVAAILVAVTACASPTMSATEHRQHAAEAEAQAARHEAQYDEGARAAHLDTPIGDVSLAPPDYNPTHFELDAANAYSQAARKHLDAAHALESSEDAACQDVPRAARGACPLFAPVAIEDITHGVRLRFADDETATKAAALARCQQAFARTRGFKDLPTCILYARGLSVSQRDRTLELVAADDEGAARVRVNVRSHHAPAFSPSAASSQQ